MSDGRIAALYLRKSTDEGEGSAGAVKSVEVQRAIVSDFAPRRGLTIDARYVYSDDGAEFLQRPGL